MARMTDPKPIQPAGDPQRETTRDAAKRIDRINDRLHVGGALPPDDYKRFQEAGITHVVDLREEPPSDSERPRELGIARRHVPVPDRGPPTVDQLVEVASWLAEGHGGARMYVHCKGGFGRAATMAVGLLIFRYSAKRRQRRNLTKIPPGFNGISISRPRKSSRLVEAIRASCLEATAVERY
jgi:protein tyrosine phosphatase (PTP) superfamily phosphohydrolase (DUF442 family)